MLDPISQQSDTIRYTNTGRTLTNDEYWKCVESKSFMAHIDYMNQKDIDKWIAKPKIYRIEEYDE